MLATFVRRVAIAAPLAACTLAARADDPRFWATWYNDRGLYPSSPTSSFTPWSDARIKPLLIVWLPFWWDSSTYTLTQQAQEAAQETVDLINQFGLGDDEVAIFISGFGSAFTASAPYHMPTLTLHAGDALTDSGPWEEFTLWTSNGVDECANWMDEYIATFATIQLLGVTYVPDPARFHFDSEYQLYPESSLTFTFPDTRDLYERALLDGRATTEPILGFPGGSNTLATLPGVSTITWTNGVGFGSPGSYTSQQLDNQDWIKAYHAASYRTYEAAMDVTAYSKIRAEWPKAMSSNYTQSMKLDGVDGRVFVPGTWAGVEWHQFAWEGFGDLQAPALYPLWWGMLNLGETILDGTIRYQRRQLDACVRSFGGANMDAISPWIPLAGQAWPGAYQNGAPYITTKRDLREVVALARGRGVQEFIVWLDSAMIFVDTQEHWDVTEALLDEVWGASVASCSSTNLVGSVAPASMDRVYEGDLFEMQSAVSGVKVEGEIVFDSSFYSAGCGGTGEAPYINVVVEGEMSMAGTMEVFVKHQDGRGWEPIGSATSPAVGVADRRLIVYARDVDAANNIVDCSGCAPPCSPDPRGMIEMKVVFTGTGSYPVGQNRLYASVDLTQIVKVTALPCPADFNGDEVVDSDDVAQFAAAYAAGTATPPTDPTRRADFNLDGVVDSDDATDFAAAYITGCP